jgi:hypothetical protein
MQPKMCSTNIIQKIFYYKCLTLHIKYSIVYVCSKYKCIIQNLGKRHVSGNTKLGIIPSY